MVELKIYCGPHKFYGPSKFGQYDGVKNRAPLMCRHGCILIDAVVFAACFGTVGIIRDVIFSDLTCIMSWAISLLVCTEWLLSRALEKLLYMKWIEIYIYKIHIVVNRTVWTFYTTQKKFRITYYIIFVQLPQLCLTRKKVQTVWNFQDYISGHAKPHLQISRMIWQLV